MRTVVRGDGDVAHTTDITEEILLKRYEVVGGVPRHLSTDLMFDRQATLVERLEDELSLEQLVSFANFARTPRAIDSAMYSVFQLKPVSPLKASHVEDGGVCLDVLR